MNYSENDSKELEETSSIIKQLMYQCQKNEKDYESLEEILKSLLLCCEKFNKSFDKYEQMKAKFPPNMNQEVLQSVNHETLKIQKLCRAFKVSRIVLLNNLNLIIETADYVLDEIVDTHLQNWRDKQKPAHTNEDQEMDILNKIQNWCENLAKVLFSTRNYSRMGPMFNLFLNELDETIPEILQHMFADVSMILISLVKSTVIIEKQPPQVLLSNETFSTNIRLLVGDALDIKKTSVKVSIVSQQQAQNFEKLVEKSDLKCGKLKNSSGKIKFDKESSNLVATFDALKLSKINKSGDNVLVEKFGILFQSKFTICDSLDIYIKVLSMPIVLNVSGERNPASNVPIWDNVFPIYNYQQFDLVCFMKSLQFKLCLRMIVCALSEKVLVAPKLQLIMEFYLESKKKFALSRTLSDDGPVSTREQFSKLFLRGSKINFMEWFYSAIELTQKYLCELWIQNYIIGFIDKKSAEKILLECEPGTFLLRLSDSQNVGLVIDYCKLNDNDEKYVLHYEPLTSKDLKLCSLADRILGLVELKMLYRNILPNINKDAAFSKYASNRIDQKNGSDTMEADSPLLSFSEVRLNYPIDSSIPASTYTATPMPALPSYIPRTNYYPR